MRVFYGFSLVFLGFPMVFLGFLDLAAILSQLRNPAARGLVMIEMADPGREGLCIGFMAKKKKRMICIIIFVHFLIILVFNICLSFFFFFLTNRWAFHMVLCKIGHDRVMMS